jgi:glutamate synthase (NADPH/NADH) small chain
MCTGSPVTVRENEHAIIENTAYESRARLTACPAAGPHRQARGRGRQQGPAGLSVAEYLNKRGHTRDGV